MEQIMRIVAFTGNQEIELAISDRLGYTDDYIYENKLTLPDGSYPPENWPCAIFTPEAGMYGFNLRWEFDGTLWDKEACKRYNLPESTETAVYMSLTGTQADIEKFCQAICDQSGMTCHFVEDLGDKYQFEKTLFPARASTPTDKFLDLLFESYEC